MRQKARMIQSDSLIQAHWSESSQRRTATDPFLRPFHREHVGGALEVRKARIRPCSEQELQGFAQSDWICNEFVPVRARFQHLPSVRVGKTMVLAPITSRAPKTALMAGSQAAESLDWSKRSSTSLSVISPMTWPESVTVHR